MILVDTGPLVALFDPRDDAHSQAKRTLERVTGRLVTTTPVLSEAFHLLDPASQGAVALRAFITRGGLSSWYLSDVALARAFELMERYSDRPMDLADASLVVAAETLRTTHVFTIDRNDFCTYRARIGKTLKAFKIVD